MAISYKDVNTTVEGLPYPIFSRTYMATSLTIDNSLSYSPYNQFGKRGIWRADGPVGGSLSLSAFVLGEYDFTSFITNKNKTVPYAVGGTSGYLASLNIQGDPTTPVSLDLQFESVSGFTLTTTAPATGNFSPALGVLSRVSGLSVGSSNYSFSYSLTKNYGRLLYRGGRETFYLQGGEERVTVESDTTATLASPCPNTTGVMLELRGCTGDAGKISVSGNIVDYSSAVSEGDIVRNTLTVVNTF